MSRWKFPGLIYLASILLVAQYVLAFFVYKLPGLKGLQWVGWGIWLLSCYCGIAPIFIFRKRGGVAKGESYVKTTRLVTNGPYAVVRHPQYVAGILLTISMMLLAQHWLVILLGFISAFLIFIDIQAADQEGIKKFGDDYRKYMNEVPQANFIVGVYRYFRRG
jgi:protein-S-isoprenylcysteine O-methyltransferase Ste14